ncbi:hypothetical protein, partial [Bradyrhizobium ivorense]|uniref:hypothetical protein n=1 Tax=Bradyrhizobium ivorense TaxID=2511166 RepID=UPI001E4EB85B
MTGSEHMNIYFGMRSRAIPSQHVPSATRPNVDTTGIEMIVTQRLLLMISSLQGPTACWVKWCRSGRKTRPKAPSSISDDRLTICEARGLAHLGRRVDLLDDALLAFVM